MKLLILLLIVVQTSAQPILGLHVVSNGIGVHAGYQHKSLVSISGMTHTGNTATYYTSLGVHKEISQYNFVRLSLGYSVYKYRDFTDYDKGGDIHDVNQKSLYSSIEIFRDLNTLMPFATLIYMKKFYYGVGIRCLFKKNIK